MSPKEICAASKRSVTSGARRHPLASLKCTSSCVWPPDGVQMMTRSAAQSPEMSRKACAWVGEGTHDVAKGVALKRDAVRTEKRSQND